MPDFAIPLNKTLVYLSIASNTFTTTSGENAHRFDRTEREQEILSLLMKGMSYKMIAESCNISFHTVNGHCKKIYEKLHAHSATEAVAKAIEQWIV